MGNNVTFMKPTNPPGTPPDEQRCEYCLISLGGKDHKYRSKISKDPDYIDANLCIYCAKCRKSKLGRVPDSDYLDPPLKWRRITYQMFYNSGNAEGLWRLVEALRPFGPNAYDPRVNDETK